MADYKKAFPISSSDKLSEKILNEENITGIIKNICGRDKFIIGTYEENNKTYIKFILDGYYFEIEKPDPDDSPSYASLEYSGTANTDIGKIFKELTIGTSGGLQSLQLTDGNGDIVEANKIRFNSDQVELPHGINISCGRIE